MHYHLAQANIARMRRHADSPVMADLVARIAEMNELAERSPGFVWRLPGSQVTAEDLRAFEGYVEPFDPGLIFYNMSVWASIEDLHSYVFVSRHREMLRDRHAWIAEAGRASLAMWWIPAGHRPTVAESAERLRTIDERGPTEFAFSFRQTFPPPRPTPL